MKELNKKDLDKVNGGQIVWTGGGTTTGDDPVVWIIFECSGCHHRLTAQSHPPKCSCGGSYVAVGTTTY